MAMLITIVVKNAAVWTEDLDRIRAAAEAGGLSVSDIAARDID